MAKRRQITNLFSSTLVLLMKERKVTVKKAADWAQVPPATIQNWRSGHLPTDFASVRRLAEGLGTTLAFLLTGEHDQRLEGLVPTVTELFKDGGEVFDGYLEVKIRKMIPREKRGTK